MTRTYREAVDRFIDVASGSGYAALPAFRDGTAMRVAEAVDRRVQAGADVWPRSQDVFTALELTPLAKASVVLLGQDPYPTPGDAHGLAFSIAREGRLPRSLANVFKELANDMATPLRQSGQLSDWARQGVLLLNTSLTVEAGLAGSHRKLGWTTATDQIIAAVSALSPGSVFLLWGADAQAKRALINESRHRVIASAHPSPLSASRGYFGSRPFSQANDWLSARDRPPIAWG